MSSARLSKLLIIWTLSILSFFIPITTAQAGTFNNVSIATNSSRIVYTPFLCNAGNSSFAECAWRTVDVDGEVRVSTEGPGMGNSLIPQMFFTFRATSLFLTTPAPSNATVNISITTGTFVISRLADSALGQIRVINLNESDTTTLSISFIAEADQTPSRLDIGSLSILVSDESNTSSFLPTMTLPPSIALPSIPLSTSVAPTATSTPTGGADDHRKLVAIAVGVTVGLGVGLTLLAAVIFLLWRRRRWRQAHRDGFEDSRAQANMSGRHSVRSQFFN